MSISLVLFFFFVTLNTGLREASHRLAGQRHEQAALWLAVSGADLAEARLREGTLKAGEVWNSPQFRQGRFAVTTSVQGSRLTITSTGYAADRRSVKVRTVALP